MESRQLWTFINAAKMGSLMSSEQERKGPAEETLQVYTAYMRSLLEQAGLTE